MKKLTEQQAEMFKQLNGVTTYPGLFGLISGLGALLALIGCLCPFFSYNPTVVDDFKRTISLFDLSPVALIVAVVGLLFLIIAIFMRVFQFSMLTKYLQDTEKKSIGKKLLVSSGFLVFFALLSLILVQVSAVFYENPEFDSFEWQLTLENDAGAILYYIGIVLFVLFNIFNSLILKQYMDGKVAIEKLTFIRKRDEGIRKESETTVQEQLSEWKKLLDEGVITQEEYDRKKTELLNKS